MGQALGIKACELRLIELSELFEVGCVGHKFEQPLPGLTPTRFVNRIIELKWCIGLTAALADDAEECIGVAAPGRQFQILQCHRVYRRVAVLKPNPAIGELL